MPDEEKALRAITIRFSEDELLLLAETQAVIAKIANNPDLRVTQRAAIVSALKLYVHEKTRRSAK